MPAMIGILLWLFGVKVGAKMVAVKTAAALLNQRNGFRPGEGILTPLSEVAIACNGDETDLGGVLFQVAQVYPEQLGKYTGKAFLLTESEYADLVGVVEVLLATQSPAALGPVVRFLETFPDKRVK